MPVPLIAVGCLCMVKASGVMGTYSMHNYDANPGSAYDRHQSLPGTDGKPLDIGKKKSRFDKDGKPVNYRAAEQLVADGSCGELGGAG
ncbi:hypothetical protein T484DRAFT_1894228 [Baffinella frigidus]|nr:hypothetical protein T484DRAFT_1894228 [Cryptophyta sp. CCMP2293]